MRQGVGTISDANLGYSSVQIMHRPSPCLGTIKELVSSLPNNKVRAGAPSLQHERLRSPKGLFSGVHTKAERSSPRRRDMADNDLPTQSPSGKLNPI